MKKNYGNLAKILLGLDKIHKFYYISGTQLMVVVIITYALRKVAVDSLCSDL